MFSCNSGGGSDPGAAEDDVEDGIDALKDIYEDYDGDISSVNLEYALDAFESAVANDSSNPDAQLGLAFVRFVSLQQNIWSDEIEGMIDELDDSDLDKNYLDISLFSKKYFKIFITNFKYYLNSFSSMYSVLNRDSDGPPDLDEIPWDEISDLLNQIHNHIDNVLIDELTKIIDGLNRIPNDYEFEITGKMQGDNNKESRYIKKGDVDFLKMHVYRTRAASYMISTYNLAMGNSNNLNSLFGQNSQFLKIRSGNQWNLSYAHDDLNSFCDSGEDWATGETGIITLLDEENEDIEEALDNFNNVRLSINNIISDDGVSIDLSGFMHNPPNNLKDIIPGYTITTNSDEVCIEWDADTINEWIDGFDLTLGGLLTYPLNTSILLEALDEADEPWEKEMCR